MFCFFYLFEFLGNDHTLPSHADGRLSREANPFSHPQKKVDTVNE